MFRMMYAGEEFEVSYDGDGFDIEPPSDELDAILSTQLLQLEGIRYLPTAELVEFEVAKALGIELPRPVLEEEDGETDH